MLLQEADLSHVLVRAFVDEPDIGRLQVGQKVEVTWDAIPGRIMDGHGQHRSFDRQAAPQRNVGETTCTVDNLDLRLLPNINVGVTIVVAEHEQRADPAARCSAHADDSKPYVFKIVDDHVKRQPIEISLQNLTRVEITSGLSEGASVALPAEETKPLVRWRRRQSGALSMA